LLTSVAPVKGILARATLRASYGNRAFEKKYTSEYNFVFSGQISLKIIAVEKCAYAAKTLMVTLAVVIHTVSFFKLPERGSPVGNPLPSWQYPPLLNTGIFR